MVASGTGYEEVLHSTLHGDVFYATMLFFDLIILTGSQQGSSSNSSIALEMPIVLKSGKNDIALSSMIVGLQVLI